MPATKTTCVSVAPMRMEPWPPVSCTASLKESEGTFSSKLPSSEEVSTCVSQTARR